MTPPEPERGRVGVTVDGRVLTVSSLDKILFPATGTTKGEVLAYVAAVAPALLDQLADRPLTRVRWPHGTSGESFFEKNVPAGAPDWVRRVTLDSPGSRGAGDRVTYPLIDDLAGLTWVTNLGALELHVPQWRVAADGTPQPPDRLVVDLDPGAPAGLAECARVAILAREALARVGYVRTVPVTSGSKGMQLYAAPPGAIPATGDGSPREVAKAIAEDLERREPALVLSSMAKAKRPGKVFLDWSQNTPAKTTICPYSLRGKRDTPYVAAPRDWAEVEAAAEHGELWQATPEEVMARLSAEGDLMATLR
ncbi:MAG: non-homologous end-joining DNA ligase [Austwickia sp.]|nr:non-homologous end-joining DNA ligase [Austwickia sp.]